MDQNARNNSIPDRRSKPRENKIYPAIVKGCDAQGRKFEEIATLTNLSASGCYLQLLRPIRLGEELRVTLYLPNPQPGQPGSNITITGVVVRTDQDEQGTPGIALKILHYRFK
jgi:hypothetical protein